MIRVIIALIMLFTLAVGGISLSKMENAAPSVKSQMILTGKVTRGDMKIEVKGVGTLVSEDMMVVPSLVSGRIVKILIQPGVEVSPDTVIVKLSNPELELQLINAESDLNSARARYNADKAEMEDRLMGMEASYAQAKANYQAAQLRNKVETQQYKDGLISMLKYTLSTDSVKNQKELLEIQKKRLYLFEEQTKPAQLAVSQASVEQAESMYQLRKSQVDSLNVTAGVSGVLAPIKEKIEPGIQISSGQVLARVTNPDKLKAQLQVPQSQARNVKIGLPVEIDTYNGVIGGMVSRVEPTVVNGNILIDVSLDSKLPKGALPDLSVIGTILIDHLLDCIHAAKPVSANSDSKCSIFKVIENGLYAKRVHVQFGRVSLNNIEIVDGLSLGDEIILSDTSQFDDVDKIKIQ